MEIEAEYSSGDGFFQNAERHAKDLHNIGVVGNIEADPLNIKSCRV